MRGGEGECEKDNLHSEALIIFVVRKRLIYYLADGSNVTSEPIGI